MAIALNTASTHVTSTNARRAYRARVVPAASVWDADVYDVRRAGVTATPHDVRTLSVDNRTYGAPIRRCANAESAGHGEQEYSRAQSNRANYLLGAVFGAAVFVGTVFGGLTADTGAVHTENTQVVQAGVTH